MLDKFAIPEGTELRFGIAKSQTLEDGTILKGNREQFEIITNSIGEKPPAELFDYEHKIPLLP